MHEKSHEEKEILIENTMDNDELADTSIQYDRAIDTDNFTFDDVRIENAMQKHRRNYKDWSMTIDKLSLARKKAVRRDGGGSHRLA